jgi:hypothetical protein
LFQNIHDMSLHYQQMDAVHTSGANSDTIDWDCHIRSVCKKFVSVTLFAIFLLQQKPLYKEKIDFMWHEPSSP